MTKVENKKNKMKWLSVESKTFSDGWEEVRAEAKISGGRGACRMFPEAILTGKHSLISTD